MDFAVSSQFTSPAKIDFLIVTALREEREAVLKKLSGFVRLPPDESTFLTFYEAELEASFPGKLKHKYRLIVTSLAGMGLTRAANYTTDAVLRWRPRYVLLVGIAGGIAARDVSLGDVLLCTQVHDYELQKVKGGQELVRLQSYPVDERLRIAADNLDSADWMSYITTSRPEPSELRLHTGPIASGNKVVASPALLKKLISRWPDLIGIEMEAGGVAAATIRRPELPGFFMIRGVSDLADAEKDSVAVRAWRLYACDVAAAYTMGFLQAGPIPVVGLSSFPLSATTNLRLQRLEQELQDLYETYEMTLQQIRATIDGEIKLTLRRKAEHLENQIVRLTHEIDDLRNDKR